MALFVHARPDHTQQTLDALAANMGAADTEIIVFADGPRSSQEAEKTDRVRAVVRQAHGFKAVTLIVREDNLGLAQNITDGVTHTIEKTGRVIVLEDDIITHPGFLSFMNHALDRYADETRVWHVNGWTYPIRTQVENRAFFTSVMECWGWATWQDRWVHYDRSADRFLGKWSRDAIRRFNIGGGYDYWGDIKRNAYGSVRTWAVFWYALIFERGGLCLSPPQSLTTNIGIDGSGANSGSRDIFATSAAAEQTLPDFPSKIVEDERAWALIRTFLLSKRPWIGRRALSRAKWWAKGVAARLQNARRVISLLRTEAR